jgi:hypothetical protein
MQKVIFSRIKIAEIENLLYFRSNAPVFVR